MTKCKNKILLQDLYKNEYDRMQKQDFYNTFYKTCTNMYMTKCKNKTLTILLQNLYKNEYDKMQKQDFDNTFTKLVQK